MDDLRLKRRNPVLSADHVHGGWWPYSRNLETELEPLLAALTSGGFQAHRVTYSTRGWNDAPRVIALSGRAISLAGYYSQQTETLVVTDAPRQRRLVLLVVPPDVDPRVAAHAMSGAAQDGNGLRVADIMRRACAELGSE